MKKKQCIVLWTLTLMLASCVGLKKHEEAIHKNVKLSDYLMKANQEKSALLLFTDSLQTKNNAAANQIIGYQQSSASYEYQMDSLLFDSEENQSTTAALMERVAVLNEAANTVLFKNIIVRKVDTVQKIAHELNTGKVAFYCPSEMYYNQTYDAYGLIADVLSNEVIKKMVVKKIKQHAPDTAQVDLDNKDFLIRAVQFYEIIELTLDNVVNKGFDIIKIHLQDQQVIANKTKTWHWKVTPLSTAVSQQLILKIIVYDTAGVPILDFDKTYLLEVKIKPYSFFHNTKVLFIENPKWAFSAILLPLITFFGGRYQRRKKTASKETS